VRAGVVVALVALTFVASRSCQQDQVRLTKEQAIATAKQQVRFKPTHTIVRLLRQGVPSRPNWIVSLSIPRPHPQSAADEFKELAVVRVDANTGKVVDVKVQR
jgi:hypothetical protein